MSAMRVGVDLVEVDDVAASIARFGDRYLRRVYTEHELASARGTPPAVAAHLAARFAAKEAVMKVLRPGDARPDWRGIEVRRHEVGWCEVALSGAAARLAEEAGVASLAVSLTHQGPLAAAVAMATCAEATGGE